MRSHSGCRSQKRVDRGFARGAAAEIAGRHDDLGLAPIRSIERKIRPFVTLGIKAQIVEQHFADLGGSRQFEIRAGKIWSVLKLVT